MLASQKCNLILSKTLFFTTALSTVGWNRFQNLFFIDNGLSNTEIGFLKSIGLVSKIVGEPALCMIADATNVKVVFAVGVLMSIFTMEILRTATPLTFNIVLYVKILRTFVSPIGTLTTTSALHLIQGSREGFGEQRAFGSIAWGIGALLIGALIDMHGMDSLFYYTYSLNIAMFVVILIAVPHKATREHSAKGHKSHYPDPTLDINSAPDRVEPEVPRHEHDADDGIPLLWRDSTGGWTRTHDEQANGDEQTDHSQPTNWRSVRLVATQLCTHIAPYWRFCRQEHLLLLFVNVFVYGLCMTTIDTFLYVAVERDFAASRTFNGLLTAVSVVGTVPAFWYSDRVIKHYGHHTVILIAQMVCCGRLLLSAFVWSCPPSLVLGLTLVLQLSHSLCFGLYWAAVVDLVTSAAHASVINGAVAIVSALYFTVGGAVGNILWGTAYDRLGSMAWVFLIAGGMVGCLVCLHWSHNFVRIS